jgi:hypothetical protein
VGLPRQFYTQEAFQKCKVLCITSFKADGSDASNHMDLLIRTIRDIHITLRYDDWLLVQVKRPVTSICTCIFSLQIQCLLQFLVFVRVKSPSSTQRVWISDKLAD